MQKINDQYEKRHLRQLIEAAKRIRSVYDDTIQEISLVASKIDISGRAFELKDYPALQNRIDRAIKKMHGSIYSTVVNGIESSWGLSNEKNNALLDVRLAGKKLSKKTKAILYDPNANGLEAFINRKEKGIDLSKRVWNLVDPYRHEIEQSLGLGISKGQSAAEMARDMKQYLNDPDKLYRRVRTADSTIVNRILGDTKTKDDTGSFKLSKAAEEYNPGQGIYRSSYKNAMRIARTETNTAYRNADHERWQTMPFVVGIVIKLSNAHPTYDICDKLAGRYPKDFHWTGWHPQCICYQVPEMMSDEEYDKIEEAMLRGENLIIKSRNEVEDTPAAFKEYVLTNKDRIAKWKSKPYWVKDNPDYFKAAGDEKEKFNTNTGQTTPSGKNIRSQFTRIDKKIADKVDNALIAIDSVHGDGMLNDIPFKPSKSKEFAAAFASIGGRPLEILLSNSSHPELSIIHEMGHYFDLHAIGGERTWASLSSDLPMAKVIEAAQQSDAIKNIQSILDNGYMTFDDKDYALDDRLRKHLRYLNSPKEIWARSYAQYIANNANNAKLTKYLDNIISNEEPLGFRSQWLKEDFNNIESSITEMMLKLGWMTNR